MKISRNIINLLFFAIILSFSGCASTNKGQQDDTADDFLSANLIKVTQSKRGVEVRLQELLLFESGKSTIKPESSKLLDEAALIIKKSKKDIAVEGYTDNVGAKLLNVRLSAERAEAVKVALVNRGIESKRLRVVGYDFQQPLAENTTEKGRAKNRRVEILMIDEKLENVGGKNADAGLKSEANSLLGGLMKLFLSVFK